MATRQAKGEHAKATKELLDLKFGDYLPAQLRMGTNPWALAEMVNADTTVVTKDKEVRDKVTRKIERVEPVEIGPLTVTAEQLMEWYPKSTEIGEPDGGHEKPVEDKPTLNKP